MTTYLLRYLFINKATVHCSVQQYSFYIWISLPQTFFTYLTLNEFTLASSIMKKRKIHFKESCYILCLFCFRIFLYVRINLVDLLWVQRHAKIFLQTNSTLITLLYFFSQLNHILNIFCYHHVCTFMYISIYVSIKIHRSSFLAL